ncbi:MAG: hypothetical protein ACON5A_06095 [Candidatus Comchoanobacterales bacterium]
MKKILCAVMCMGLSVSMYSEENIVKALVDDVDEAAEDTANIVTHPGQDLSAVENAAVSAGEGVAEAVTNPTKTIKTLGQDATNVATSTANLAANAGKDVVDDLNPVKEATSLAKQVKQNIQACEHGKNCLSDTASTLIDAGSDLCVAGTGEVDSVGKLATQGVAAGGADAVADGVKCAEEDAEEGE